jgi:hypothetical protein
MKKLNTIITACFIVVFSGAAFFTTEPVKTIVAPPAVSVPPSGDTIIKSKPGYKSLPNDLGGPDFKIPTPGKVEPTPKPVPVPPQSAVIKTKDLSKNEYVRGAIGAVIGWAVKGLCEFLYNIIVPILLFLKEALMRRFG